MNYKALLAGLGLFLLGQVLAWYQTNGQFISVWVKEHPLLVALIGGVPVGYSYILATAYVVEAFNGEIWPSRLLGFSMGITAFTILTLIHMDESITLKTGTVLILALMIILIQVLWK
tara:strand:+ start:124 stop:474 length:351 start_codon:yes stop_codon:yes gene_type:complete